MSDTNLKLVQDAYEKFGRGDVPGVLEMLTPDVTFGIIGRKEDAPFFGIRAGKAGAGEFFHDLNEAHEISKFEPLTFIAADDKVFVWGRYTWMMRKSGIGKESEWLHIFTLRGGKISAWHGHNDTAMLAAAYHATPGKRAATA